MKTKLMFFLLIMIANNVYAVKACKDENGKTYFTDVACPEGTISQDELDVKKTNTYRARDSINIDLVNDHERRYQTGRSWRWVKKQRPDND